MFFICFLIFTLVFTVFQNIQIAGISLALALVVLTIYQFVSGKKMLKRKIIISLFGGFVLAGITFGIKERKYYGGNDEYGKTFIGTGIINDISGQGKYIFSDGNHEYLLRSQKKYIIGDQLRLVGNIQSNQHTDSFSYRTISS